MPAGNPASIFRPDTRPAWIEAAHVVAFFLLFTGLMIVARYPSGHHTFPAGQYDM